MRQACVFLSLSLALILGAPFPSPSKLYKRQPNEVKQKSATDGGKCKLLHLKKAGAGVWRGARRSLSIIFPTLEERVVIYISVSQDRQPVERMSF